MRKILLALFCVIVSMSPAFCDVALDEAHFPDPVFREYLRKEYDRFGGYDEYGNELWASFMDQDPYRYSDGILSDIEIQKIKLLTFSAGYIPGILKLDGIKYLTSLTKLVISARSIYDVDVSGMKNLQTIEFDMNFTYVEGANITVNAENCTSLTSVSAKGANTLNLRGCSSLKELSCDGVVSYWLGDSLSPFDVTPTLESLDLEGCYSLETVNLASVKITQLNLPERRALKSVTLYSNTITALNLRGCTSLDTLDCAYNALETINIEGCGNLRYLDCTANSLETIDVTSCTKLEMLYIGQNCLTYLDLTHNKSLIDFYGGDQRAYTLKAEPYGNYWKVDFSDYMPVLCAGNIMDIITAESFGGGCKIISFNAQEGYVIIETPNGFSPTKLNYLYNTNSMNNTMEVSLQIVVINSHVYGGRMSEAVRNIDSEGYITYENTYTGEKKYLKEDYDFSAYHDAEGFTADGNSRLIITAMTSDSGSVTFSIPPSLGAVLETLDRSRQSTISLTVKAAKTDSGEYRAAAVLTAPESLPSGCKFPADSFKLTASFTDSNGHLTFEEHDLKICVAPVVLIHGLRGKTKDTFSVNGDSGIWYQLTQAGYDPSRDINYCDYDGTKGPEDLLNRDYNVVYYALQKTFTSYRSTGIECTRADIVAHSMGGLMARKFLQEGLKHETDGGHNWGIESYRQGMVRRVVTVATPHRGSPFAEDLISTSGMNSTARNALNSVLNYSAGMELDANADSAYRDLLPDSQTYGFPETVPFHSIYGDISTGLTIAEIVANITPVRGLAVAAIRSVFDSKFPKQGHDLVVSVPSAGSNFKPEYTTEFSDLSVTKYNHLNICKQDDVGKRVVELLKGPVTNFQIGGYNQPNVKPVIADTVFPIGIKGIEYEPVTMQLSAGNGNVKWKASGLPSGLKISSAGVITGTPKKAKSAKVKITAQNEAGRTTKQFTITVCELPTIRTKSLKAGKSDKKYRVSLSASGTKPFTWSATGLPEGLEIDPSKGVIEGIAESCVGDFAVTVTASNIAGSVRKDFTLKMNGVAPTIKGSLKTGKTFRDYTAKFTATGTKPITWTLSGNLPAGLEFDSDTATISGIPEESCKRRELTLTASNKVKSVSKILRLTINETKKRAENSSPSLEHEATETLTPLTHNEAVNPNIYANDNVYMNFNGIALYEGCKIAARLLEISVDIPGMYDFEITLSDDVQTGEELIYIANSSEPSDDDYIAEFYDDTGTETANVPENKKILLSIWLRKGIIYAPVVIVKEN